MMRRTVFASLILFLSFPLCLFSQSVITVSVPPGSYSSDQRIALSTGGEERIFYSFANSRKSRFIEYLVPFTLSAIEGEERHYTLRVEARIGGETVRKKEFQYLIDKKPPEPPEVSIPEGTYGNPISISLIGPQDSSMAYSYHYCINACIRDDARLWTGEPIQLQAEEQGVVSHTVKAYASDAAGNLSELKVWTYTIDTSETVSVDALRILSPVEGVFANKQYLVVRASGYEWVKYTLGGEDPAEFGARYSGPLLMNLDGTVKVRVAGKHISTGEIRTAEVEFTVEEPRVEMFQLESGIYDEPFLIQLESRDMLYYSLDDTPAARKALRYESPFKIDLVTNGLKYIAFRVISGTDIETGLPEARYFFIFDDRSPSKPEIVFNKKPPVREDAEVTILGPEDARIFYTIDGTSPDTSSMEYGGPFTLNLPEGSEAGSLLVKASAYGSNGRKSSVSSELVTFDRIAPAAPEITYLGQSSAGGITVGVKSEFGSTILFEMTLDDSLPAKPSLKSYKSEGFISLDVPYGMERIFAFRFVAADNAGNLSMPTDPFRVLVDKMPPEVPNMRYGDDSISIIGSDTIYYSLTTDGSEPKTPDSRSNTYTEPIQLNPVDEVLNEYKIKAVSVDPSGNSSVVSSTFTHVVDRRKPYMPDYTAPENGGIYSTVQKISLKSGDDVPSVYYTFTADGSEPLEPDSSSLKLEDEVLFEGAEGESTAYHVKLKPFYDERLLSGDVHELQFVVDVQPPEVPFPGGIENGATYSHGISLLPPTGIPDDVFISIISGENELYDPLGESGRRFSGPIHLDAKGGNEKTYRFSLAARDGAGNSTVNPTIYTVTIDKKPPPKPVVAGVPAGGLTRDNVEIIVSSQYPVYYEFSKDGTLPPPPDSSSLRFDERLVLSGESGKEILYTVRFLSIDEVGNESEHAIARFTIDKQIPEAATKPQVKFAGDSTASISWHGISENKIYYSVSSDNETSLDSYIDYNMPFTLFFEELGESLILSYYVKDKAGNRSIVSSINLDLPGRTVESLFNGVENGMLYNSRCTIVRTDKQANVRYEVTTNGPIPPELSPFSNEMPETLYFDAAPGETLRFALRAAVFKEGNASPVKEQIVRFTIDKTPPPAPEVKGWKEEMFFQDDFQLELAYAEGDAYVSVNNGSFMLYGAPITLKSVSGGIDKYEIASYAKDEAGNKSIETKRWVAYIDRQVIYVSQNGNDLFDGSRTKPFRTVSAAIEESNESERKTIYISEGTYSIYEPISFSGRLGIYGGFSEENWHETNASNTTHLLVAREFPRGQTLFSVEEKADVVLENLTVRPAVEEMEGPLMVQRGGALEVSNCIFSFESFGNNPMFFHSAGDALIRKTVFSAKDVRGEELIKSLGNTLDMRECSASYENSSKNTAVMRANGVARLSLSSCAIEPGIGKTTSGLVAVRSSVLLEDTKIDSGQGTTKAIALRLQESDLRAERSIFIGNRSSWISTCIDSSFSDMEIINGRIDARAARGTVSIRAEGTKINLDSTRIRGLGGEEFIYLLDLSNCTGIIMNNMLSGTDTRDFIGFSVTESALTIVNNSIAIGNGVNMSSGIVIKESKDIRILNNIIHGPPQRGTAVETNQVGAKLKILSNAFDGWNTLLKTPTATAVTPEEMNSADQTPGSGEILGNITESKKESFSSSSDGVFLLKTTSACVNAAFNPILLNIIVREDYQGESRNDPYDIGADEAY